MYNVCDIRKTADKSSSGALCGIVIYDFISLNPSKIFNSQMKRKNSDL